MFIISFDTSHSLHLVYFICGKNIEYLSRGTEMHLSLLVLVDF